MNERTNGRHYRGAGGSDVGGGEEQLGGGAGGAAVGKRW
jgi:hypothetical protein